MYASSAGGGAIAVVTRPVVQADKEARSTGKAKPKPERVAMKPANNKHKP